MRSFFKLFISFSLILIISQENINAQDYDHWETVVFNNDQWKYLVPEQSEGNSWVNIDFDDSAWQSGQGGFGFGDGDDNTVIPSCKSVFLRKKFNITDATDIAIAILHMDYDDAFVAYLNGVEIARANIGTKGIMPHYTQSADTYKEAEMYSGGKPEDYILDTEIISTLLNSGENILAVQVHNYGDNSSDLSSNVFLSVAVKSSDYNYRPTPSWFKAPLSYKSKLPLLVIETDGQEIVDEPKITATLKVVDHKDGTLNSHLDAATSYHGKIGIEIRGQSSQMFPKKSYSIETRDELGEGIDFPLLDLNTEEDWALYAPYSDKSLLRNALTFKLAESLSNWHPKFKFCEVYINDEYKGVYLLMEKIKKDDFRVDVNKLKPEEISGDDLTGGYIFKVDKTWDLTENEYFRTYPSNKYKDARNYEYTYVYPKAEDIVYQQKNYIRSKIQAFENALNGSNFKDGDSGYASYIDINSFVEFMIFNELTNNVDGYRYSTYFYKKKDSNGGKIYAGPLWDFNLGYGNVDYAPENLSTSGWLYDNYGPEEWHTMHWWARMMEDDAFKRVLKDRWIELRATVLSDENIRNTIDQMAAEIGDGVERNFERWDILGEYVWPNSFVGNTYESEINYLKNWTIKRLAWMDYNIPFVTELAIDNELIEKYRPSIFPNPVRNSEVLKLQLTTEISDNIEVRIFDLQGKQLYQDYETMHSQGKNIVEIKMPLLNNGIYIIEVSVNSNLIKTERLIINN